MNCVRKLDGWEPRLMVWAASRIGLPFQWGMTDCAMLCAEAFDLMTGSAYAEDLRGRYSTVAEAVRYQRTVNNLWDGLRSAGCVAIRSPMAVQCGDFIVARSKGFWCGHVSLGDMALSCAMDADIARLDTMSIIMNTHVRVLRVA